ncbi:MAG: phytanoyl-CoA dioxygenase family protein [Caldilineaceae bacterium]|nr:phytanoyl-CoA dioxygenase family protein [Caldilineaceae bacterium]
MRYDTAIVPQQLNPTLTPELEQEVKFFLKWGYLVIDHAISPEQVTQLQDALAATFQRTQSQFTHQLLEEDERFAFLLDNPAVLARIKALLGNCIQLHSATARVTEPGAPDQSWHRDGPWPVDPDGTPYGSIPGQINCGYYLDALTMENGPIVVVPGSHRAPFKPPVGYPRFPDEKFILAQPGQAILFDGWLYHRGAANQSKTHRRVCLMCYQNAWMKSRESFSGPRVSQLKEAGTAEQKLLLGGVPQW